MLVLSTKPLQKLTGTDRRADGQANLCVGRLRLQKCNKKSIFPSFRGAGGQIKFLIEKKHRGKILGRLACYTWVEGIWDFDQKQLFFENFWTTHMNISIISKWCWVWNNYLIKRAKMGYFALLYKQMCKDRTGMHAAPCDRVVLVEINRTEKN